MSRVVALDGDSAITAQDGKIVFGPITKEQAAILARRVIAGEKYALTDPLALGTLATAFLVFGQGTDPEAVAAEQPKPVEPGMPAKEVVAC